MLMTVVLQSSSATVVMMVGLTGIGLLSLRQASAVVLGADVGTTLLVLVLSMVVRVDSMSLAFSILILGFASTFFLRTGILRAYANSLLGFGFVFFGLTLIAAESLSLKESSLFREIVSALSQHQSAALFFALASTALLQSSAAVIGVLLSFASSGLLTLEQAFPFLLGANLGGTIGPLLVGWRSQTDGKRLAFLHASTKILTVAIFFPLIGSLSVIVTTYISTPSYQVACAHILFNLSLATLFLPMIPFLARLISRCIPAIYKEERFGPKYLDQQALDNPTLAFANVFREILRMAEIAQEMVAQALIPFEEPGRDAMERLEELDDQVDRLDREIKFYLAKMSQSQFTEAQARRQLELLMLTHDLESIGDVVTKEVVELAEKKRRKNVSFSAKGWEEIQDFHRKVMENFHLAITSLASGDAELGQKVIRHKKHLALIEQELGQKHLMRLHQGLKESIETSSIHLDILTALRRTNSIISKLAYPVLDRRA